MKRPIKQPRQYQYRAGTNDIALRMEQWKGQGALLKTLTWVHSPFTEHDSGHVFLLI